MEEDILKKKETETISKKNSSNNKKIIMVILSLIIIALIGVGVYFGFIKKDKQDNNNENTSQIVMAQHAKSYVGDLYLDEDGKLYFSLSKDVENNANLKALKQKQKNYTNVLKNDFFDDDSISAIILDDYNIDKIDYLKNGQSGMGYFTILTNDNYLHVISDEQIENDGVIEIIKPNLLYDIESIGVDTNTDGVSAYAMNGSKEKIYIYDAIEGNIPPKTITKTNQDIKLNGKNIKLRIESINDELSLYINDKKATTYDYHNDVVAYVTEKFIIIALHGCQCRGDVLIGAINENGEHIEIKENKYVDCYGMHFENGKVLAKAETSNEYDLCGDEEQVELVYNVNNIEIKAIK